MTVRFKQFRVLFAFCFLLSTRNPCIAQDQTTEDDQTKQIQALIQQLAEIEDPYLGLSPTMTGTGFAPVPGSEQMRNGILMKHGLKKPVAFAKLVELGPVALPYLLKSIDDQTPTKLKIEHSGFFGGMWYAHRPAVRWVAGEVEEVQYLIQEKMEVKIGEYFDLSSEFIENAKNKIPESGELGVVIIPRSQQEFNPKNPLEKKILDPIRQKYFEPRAKTENTDLRDSSLKEYIVTVGDVCYVIIGQITNRSYLAVQYQPTACICINSPTNDEQIATDVRSVWNSDKPSEMLFESLKTDLNSNVDYQQGAVIRLDYYYPEQSEPILLRLLSEIEAPLEGDEIQRSNKSYEYSELLENLVFSKNPKIRQRTLEILRTTSNVTYFLALHKAYGKEYDPLVLKRATELLLTLPGKTDDFSGQYLLQMMGERFPTEAKTMYQKFVESESKYRREIVINALWGKPLAPEVLAPLLQDERFLDNGERVCDLAAEAIERSKPINPEEMKKRHREEFERRVNQQKKSENAQENQSDPVREQFIEQLRQQERRRRTQQESDENR